MKVQILKKSNETAATRETKPTATNITSIIIIIIIIKHEIKELQQTAIFVTAHTQTDCWKC
jgi:hypothetical protein